MTFPRLLEAAVKLKFLESATASHSTGLSGVSRSLRSHAREVDKKRSIQVTTHDHHTNETLYQFSSLGTIFTRHSDLY